MPIVSVIIPCYNQGQFLNEAVASVLAQTLQDFEIIIVNDGSTDDETLKIVDNYHNSKTTIIHTPNQGLPAARNTGIQKSQGAYILPLDADDRIGPSYLEKAVEILERDEEYGIVYCEAKLFGKKHGRWHKPSFTIERMLLDNLIFAAAVFRKADWIRVGGYNTNMNKGWEDWDFWLSIIELGRKVYRIPTPLFYYRIKKNSMANELTKDDYIRLHTQLYRNHPKLYDENIHILFKAFYSLKLSPLAKLERFFRNPRRLYDKFFRI